jgi:hypothetical protein
MSVDSTTAFSCSGHVFGRFVSTSDKTENLLLYYELYTIILPMCTVATVGKAMYIYCGTGLDVIQVPIANFQKSSFFVP